MYLSIIYLLHTYISPYYIFITYIPHDYLLYNYTHPHYTHPHYQLNYIYLVVIMKEAIRQIIPMVYSLATWHLLNTHVFSISQSEGGSMLPTINSGTILFIDRMFLRSKVFNRGDVVVASQPTNPDVQICKRVTNVEGDEVYGIKIPANYVWLQGDNKDASFDSRSYGPIPKHLILGKVINHISFQN